MKCDIQALTAYCAACDRLLKEMAAKAADTYSAEDAAQICAIVLSMQQETDRLRQSVRLYQTACNKTERFIQAVKVKK